MKDRNNTDNKSNQGFSLFTVIVALAFIGILAMLVIYIAMANFQMKIEDMKNKDNFYTAEQALEEICVGLQEEVGTAMSQAYTYVLENYSKISSDEASMDELRQSVFRERYVQELVSILSVATDSAQTMTYNIDRLKEYIDHNREFLSGLQDEALLAVVTPEGKAPELQADYKRGVLLKNLKVIYVNEKGIASIIETDIRLGIPGVQFPTPSTLPDLMNMIVVANGGIICEGGTDATANAAKPIEINGSVYAGLLNTASADGKLVVTSKKGEKAPVSIKIQDNAAVKIASGERLVCQGEVEIGNQGSFSTGATVALWAQGISLASAKVTLEGKTYLSDDLTIETGAGSQVTLSGEYYGYGTPASAGKSKNKTYYEKYAPSETDQSSAIVINGKSTTMDLSGLQKVMLAGKNYIGTGKLSVITGDANNQDVMMGESLTVKGTQLAYLAPSELLYDGKQSNPMTYDEYLKVTDKPVTTESFHKPLEMWNGKSMADLGINESEPVKTVFFNDNPGKGAVYFYLNFAPANPNDQTQIAAASKNASLYMQQYFENNTLKEKMDKYLAFYLNGGGIKVNDSNSYLRCITNGNVLTFENGVNASGEPEGKSELNAATNTDMGYLTEEQIGYQNMWYALNRKMISSYELLNEKVEDPNGISYENGKSFHNEKDASRSVYDNLVNEAEMLSFISRNHNMDDKYSNGYLFETAAKEETLSAAMLHNSGETLKYQVKDSNDKTKYVEKEFPSEKKPFVIDSELAKSLRLVICTGDVEIGNDVTFNGIIMTRGTITLKPGSKLNSAPLEAAKVFQAQITDSALSGETISPKDFFWDGDHYVLGNSLTTEQGSDTGNFSHIYNVSDFVNYENWKKK